MDEHLLIYDYPEYYEAAFAFRDVPAETDFMQLCIRRFSHIPTRRILEIACGSAPHAGELLSRGYRYIGVDNNPRMLRHAVSKWRHLTRRPRLIESDLAEFSLARPVDFAFVMVGSLFLTGEDHLLRHFESMARVIRPGGLYFLDSCIHFRHPLALERDGHYQWNEGAIHFKSRCRVRMLDKTQHIYEETWTMEIDEGGRKGQYRMVESNKANMPAEFLDFISGRTDFEFVGWWRDWDLDQPIGDFDQVIRPLAILRRRD